MKVRAPRARLTMTIRLSSWHGLLTSDGPKSSDDARSRKGSALMTLALSVTSCVSSLSCTLWIVRVSR